MGEERWSEVRGGGREGSERVVGGGEEEDVIQTEGPHQTCTFAGVGGRGGGGRGENEDCGGGVVE